MKKDRPSAVFFSPSSLIPHPFHQACPCAGRWEERLDIRASNGGTAHHAEHAMAFGSGLLPRRRTVPVIIPQPPTNSVLQRSLQGINDGAGLLMLTGSAGTGKTLLGHSLLERLGDNFTSAFLTNSHWNDRTDLLQAILFELSLSHEGNAREESRLRLTDFLLRDLAAGRCMAAAPLRSPASVRGFAGRTAAVGQSGSGKRARRCRWS